MKALIPIEVNDCRKCPNGTNSKYYTADSFDDCTEVHCSVFNGKSVGIYDWNDKPRIYSRCPYLQVEGQQLSAFNPVDGSRLF